LRVPLLAWPGAVALGRPSQAWSAPCAPARTTVRLTDSGRRGALNATKPWSTSSR